MSLTPPNRPARTQSHLNYLDSLRGLAAVYVVIHHALYTQLGKSPVLSVFAYGSYAVEFFIILSGFCLMLPVLRNSGSLPTSVPDFYLRRAWRILPTYYIALIICILWDVTIRSDRQTIGFWDIMSHILMIHDAIPGFENSINNVFWSISVEWRIYFLFPLILLAWRHWNPILVTLLVTASSMILAAALGVISPTHLTNMSTHYLGLFSMGMLAAEMCFSHRKDPADDQGRTPAFWHLSAGISLVVVILLSWFNPIVHWPYRPTSIACAAITGFLGTVILVCITNTRHGRIWHFLQFRPLVALGKFSYSLYLTHTIIVSMTYSYLVNPLHLTPLSRVVVGALISVPLSILAAYFFFLVAEKPFLKAGRKGPSLRVPQTTPSTVVGQ